MTKIPILKLIKTIFIFMFTFSSIKCFSEEIIKIANASVRSFAKEMKKEKGWSLSGSGGSFCDPDEIVISLWFDTIDRAKLPEGRKTIIETSERLIKFINKNEKYKKIFKDSIFSKKNLKLTIEFNHNNLRSEATEYILSVTLIREKILYFYLIDGKVVSKKEEIETYEQARAIVMQEKSSSQEELRSP